jgi:hypothetical protein
MGLVIFTMIIIMFHDSISSLDFGLAVFLELNLNFKQPQALCGISGFTQPLYPSFPTGTVAEHFLSLK